MSISAWSEFGSCPADHASCVIVRYRLVTVYILSAPINGRKRAEDSKASRHLLLKQADTCFTLISIRG